MALNPLNSSNLEQLALNGSISIVLLISNGLKCNSKIANNAAKQ